MDKIEFLNKQYNRFRYLCYELVHFQSDFENEFSLKDEDGKKTFNSVKELYRTLQDDAFTSVELLDEMIERTEV